MLLLKSNKNEIMWADLVGKKIVNKESKYIDNLFFYSFEKEEKLLKVEVNYDNGASEVIEIDVSDESTLKEKIKYALDLDFELNNDIELSFDKNIYVTTALTKLKSDGYIFLKDNIDAVHAIKILYNVDLEKCLDIPLDELINIFY